MFEYGIFLLHELYTIGHVIVVGRYPHCLENFTNMNKPLIAPHHYVIFIIQSNLVMALMTINLMEGDCSIDAIKRCPMK